MVAGNSDLKGDACVRRCLLLASNEVVAKLASSAEMVIQHVLDEVGIARLGVWVSAYIMHAEFHQRSITKIE